MNRKRLKGHLSYRRTPIERESPEEYGYEKIKYNLAESSVPDFVLRDLGIDLNNLTLSYGDHRGNPILRQSIADEGENINPDHVLTTTGAAGALFIIATSLLNSKDHILLLHPNYIANLETPRAIGCQIDYLRLSKEKNFKLDLSQLEELVKPNTRLISLTYPQNPTGTILTESELYEVVELAESKGCYLLLDETYREMIYNNNTPLPMVASLSEYGISVSSFSKAYGLPGIRLGWLVTQNPELMETFLAAKELIFICNSLVDEAIGNKFFTELKTRFLKDIIKHVVGNYTLLETYMKNNKYLEWIKPNGGCICFPWIKSDVNISINKFYTVLKEIYKTFVAKGYWFEVPDKFFRIGYGYPTKKELEGGLQSISKAIEESIV